MPAPILLTWVAVNNDPYELEPRTRTPLLKDGQPIRGPTLTLLFDPESPFCGKIRDVILLRRRWRGDDQAGAKAAEETREAIRGLGKGMQVEEITWEGEDPTDHRALFAFLRDLLPKLRARTPGREWIVHLSPGTPAMHTLWVLLGETGFIEPPFRLVKSYRAPERRGRPAVVPVSLGIETFFKRYQATAPRQASASEEAIRWDPRRFHSPALVNLWREARRFAGARVPVLITGERGTGKTTLAGWIRANSPYRRPELDRAWPAVACGQYSPETMRGELFGYAKGSYTGADRDHEGLLGVAHRDTLFLDEVGDVSRELQRLLIKALEEGRYNPIGESAPRESSFRLLTATNLGDAELRQRLDPDFFDRIALVQLVVPPLRELRDDLPWLWGDVLTRAASTSGLPAVTLDEDHQRRLLSALEAHPLPGNLRDLYRVALRLLAALGDPVEPMGCAEALDYALAGLPPSTTTPSSPAHPDGLARSVAAAFAKGRPLDEVLPAGAVLPTLEVLDELQTWMARELRARADREGRPVSALADVSERTLRTWAGKVRKIGSD